MTKSIVRAIVRLIAKNSDNCTICHAPFPLNSKTFGGITATGRVAFVGECCASKLEGVHVSGLSNIIDHRGIAKRAGLDAAKVTVHFAGGPWKADDAKWFAEHPDRSHRLRPIFSGEPHHAEHEPPEGHALYVIVRQIEPGQRVKLAFFRNVSIGIPEDEAIMHAVFDLAQGRGAIRIEDITRLSRQYAHPGQ